MNVWVCALVSSLAILYKMITICYNMIYLAYVYQKFYVGRYYPWNRVFEVLGQIMSSLTFRHHSLESCELTGRKRSWQKNAPLPMDDSSEYKCKWLDCLSSFIMCYKIVVCIISLYRFYMKLIQNTHKYIVDMERKSRTFKITLIYSHLRLNNIIIFRW